MSVEQVGGMSLYAPEVKTTTTDLGKDAFLQLLVAQMKYQDPMEPAENSEFVAQLAQYSSLEQLIDVNGNLESNAGISQKTNNSLVASYIGKEVSVFGNYLKVEDSQTTTGGINVSNADDINIRIIDSRGNTIDTIELGDKKVGTHYFEWDGKDSEGSQMADGDYYFEVVSADSGEVIDSAIPLIRGFVEQVRFIDNSAFIVVDGVDIDPSNIYELSATSI